MYIVESLILLKNDEDSKEEDIEGLEKVVVLQQSLKIIVKDNIHVGDLIQAIAYTIVCLGIGLLMDLIVRRYEIETNKRERM